nr:hypothetical protein CFP56_03016 [Quercus suber]
MGAEVIEVMNTEELYLPSKEWNSWKDVENKCANVRGSVKPTVQVQIQALLSSRHKPRLTPGSTSDPRHKRFVTRAMLTQPRSAHTAHLTIHCTTIQFIAPSTFRRHSTGCICPPHSDTPGIEASNRPCFSSHCSLCYVPSFVLVIGSLRIDLFGSSCADQNNDCNREGGTGSPVSFSAMDR